MARGERRTGRRGTRCRGTGRRRLTHAGWACLLAAAVASVAGCVGMPNNGSPGTFGATPQDTTQNFDFIGALPKGPQPGWNPNEIVAGFLNASASYPTYASIAREYLVGKGSNIWDPGWSVQVVDQVAPAPADIEAGDRRATVDVSGQVRASFNGTGQFVAAQAPQNGGSPDANQEFHLVKVNGEWRITNPGLIHGRMLNESDFASVYKPQDLYFFDPGSQVLVPDSVFVPAGTSPTSLVSNLVGALLKDPQTAWLKSGGTSTPPTITAFPSVTNLGANVYVTVEGTTVTVNLTGAAASASTPVLQNISAQLVWTLTGQQQNPPNIQAVQLELNGHPWVPRSAPCGGGLSPGSAQKQAMYDCFNPYPAGASANFYYVNNGQAWSRCAPENQVTQGLIGPVAPVFGRTGAVQLSQSCGRSVQAQSAASPPAQPRSQPALSMVAVSADGSYVAGVAGGTTQVWKPGSAQPSNSLPTSDVTAIGWDRTDYLWVAENDTTWMVAPASTGSSHPPIANSFDAKIVGLSVAPDGVRVAAITQSAAGPALELAAIDRALPSPGQVVNPWSRTSIGPPVRLGPNLTNPIALTWYDADDLLVLDRTASGSTLWEVPVDGQPATQYLGVPANAISITADSTQNALVVGLSPGTMAVSASLEGPWQQLRSNGQNPAFPVPVPVSAQS